MCVHHDAFRLAVGDAENDVGRLASDTIELDKFVERIGDFTVMFFEKALATTSEGTGLVAEEAGTANQGLQFRGSSGSKVGGAAVATEKGGGDEVHAGVGALRAENGGDEKLKRIVVMQGTARARIRGAQSAEDGPAARQ